MKKIILIAILALASASAFGQSNPNARKVFGRCEFRIIEGSPLWKAGCSALSSTQEGTGAFQCAYNKAAKNCQAMYQYCGDDRGSTNAWVQTWVGGEPGKPTCIIEAAVDGLNVRPEAKELVEKATQDALAGVMNDQF